MASKAFLSGGSREKVLGGVAKPKCYNWRAQRQDELVPLGYELPWDGDNPKRSVPGQGVFTAFQSSAAARAEREREREKNTREALWKTCQKKTRLFPAPSGLHLHWSRRKNGTWRKCRQKKEERRRCRIRGEGRDTRAGNKTKAFPAFQREKTKPKLLFKYLFTSYLSGFGTKQVLAWVLHVTPTSSLPSWHKSSENWKWNPSKWSAAPKKSSQGTPHALCITGRNRNPTVPKAGPAPQNSCLF